MITIVYGSGSPRWAGSSRKSMYVTTPIVAMTEISTNRAEVSATRTAFPRAS